MPPRQRRPIQSRSRGADPTINIANASAARFSQDQEEGNQEQMPQTLEKTENTENKEQKANDDLKKLIETLKNKMATNSSTPQKKAPPAPKGKTPWNRSVVDKTSTWTAKPAYSVFSRISNHEKITTAKAKQNDITVSEVPHSFLYKPGADGIKVDKLSIKSGKQLGMG
jgi:hypothetical protein